MLAAARRRERDQHGDSGAAQQFRGFERPAAALGLVRLGAAEIAAEPVAQGPILEHEADAAARDEALARLARETRALLGRGAGQPDDPALPGFRRLPLRLAGETGDHAGGQRRVAGAVDQYEAAEPPILAIGRGGDRPIEDERAAADVVEPERAA